MANFGNFPNMNHCAVENTVNSMRQVLEGLSEAQSDSDLLLVLGEERAYRELYELCEAMIEEMTRLEEAEDQDDQDDEDDEFSE